MRRTGIQAHACTQHALAACARSIRSQVRAQARTHAPHERERTSKPINALGMHAGTHAGGQARRQAGRHARTHAHPHASTHARTNGPPLSQPLSPPFREGRAFPPQSRLCCRRGSVHASACARAGRGGGAPCQAAGSARARPRGPPAAGPERRAPAHRCGSSLSLPVVRKVNFGLQTNGEGGRGGRVGRCLAGFRRCAHRG